MGITGSRGSQGIPIGMGGNENECDRNGISIFTTTFPFPPLY